MMAAANIPPVMDVLKGASAWLAARPGMALRVLILMGVWGLVVFGWSSLGEWALMQRLPPIYAAARTYSESITQAMEQQLIALTALAADPRLSTGMASEDGMESLDIRRALYEFGYMNRVTQLYLVDEVSRGSSQLAGSRPLPNEVREWLEGLDGKSPALMMTGMPEEPLLYVAVKVLDSGGYAYVTMPWSAEQWVGAMPQPPFIGDYPETVGMLVTEAAGGVWTLPLRERPKQLRDASRIRTQAVTSERGRVMVMDGVPGLPGWGVALELPESFTLGSSRLAQLMVVLAGFLATLVVMWNPMRPARQRVVETLAPVTHMVMPMVMPLAAPLLSSISAIVKSERQVDMAKMPQPGDFSDDLRRDAARSMSQSKWPTRVTAHTGGGNAFAKPKKAVISPSLGLKPTAPAKPEEEHQPEVPKATAEMTPEELTVLVDECLTLGRSQLLYQPIYRAANGMPAMHEVLLRLIDRDGKQMTPGMFMPICEREGWMDRMDAHVMEKVLQTHFTDGATPDTVLSLNISGVAMESLGYVEKLMAVATPQILQKLVFEVRSAELIKDPKAMGFLRECREMGVRLSVDYFGGGVEMIEGCKRLGFDFIKMDCLRFSVDESHKKTLIVLCRAAQRMYMAVVLERMETVAMEVFARRIGVSYLQGYLLGKPKEEMVTGPLPGWRAMVDAPAAPAEPSIASAVAAGEVAGGVGFASSAGDEAPPAPQGSDAKP